MMFRFRVCLGYSTSKDVGFSEYVQEVVVVVVLVLVLVLVLVVGAGGMVVVVVVVVDVELLDDTVVVVDVLLWLITNC